MKVVKNFQLKIDIFTAMKNCCNDAWTGFRNVEIMDKETGESLVLRKPVFGVFNQVPHKPGCTVTKDG